MEYLFAQKELWPLLKDLLDLKAFQFKTMPISFLAKLNKYSHESKQNGGDYFDFGVSVNDIITALEVVATRLDSSKK